jgi:hypothetical protein
MPWKEWSVMMNVFVLWGVCWTGKKWSRSAASSSLLEWLWRTYSVLLFAYPKQDSSLL